MTKTQRRDDNKEIALFLSGLYGFDVVMITEYQMRFIKRGARTFDYYPTSGKVCWVGTKGTSSIQVAELEKFITDNNKQLAI